MIFLPRGVPVRQNVNPARINIPEAMEKLRVGNFTGYLRFDASQGNGIIIFERGKLISALFARAESGPPLIAYDAITKVFEVSIRGEAILNIYRLEPDLAIGLHTLLHGKYIYREQELKLINVRALLDKVKAEKFNGCLRIYAEQKTALIFYDAGHALGFFHDGAAELQVSADLSKSVARLPGAKLDMLETASIDDLVLADLMASADLGPIWQRLRKLLLEDRSKREEEVIRSRQEEVEQKRRQALAGLKTIAGNYTGKFGVSQVEKAFAVVGPDMRKEEIASFFSAIERLASMVAKPEKVAQMIAEMRKIFSG
ncbi:hypothetical protein [Malonomonas rubra]|uniref:hypothetical protein n=1 Tax=Malonomonas rubra TaxID=57040 RepID=UPI0026F1F793|nr:hypothetical protein [Malonomonas rubra]